MLIAVLISGSIEVSVFGLFGGLIFGLFGGLEDIVPVEAFELSMEQLVRRGFLGIWRSWLIGWLIFGSTFGLIVGLNIGLILGLIFGLIVGLIGGLSVGLIFGLKQDLQLRLRPNQGIWNSFQSFLWTTLLSYPLGVFLVFGMTELSTTVAQSVSDGESIGVIVNSVWEMFPQYLAPGIFGALFFGFWVGGGLACVQHVCLRFVLWQSGVAPWHLAQFLNYCVERRLLQRVGGRYRFLHRELLDHFAQLQPPNSHPA